MTTQVKSKQRVADHGEVFTAEREVNAMCDLVAEECLRIDSRFLEPACGDGNFLAVILERKLSTVSKEYQQNPNDWERHSLLALGSLYGVDILQDNVHACKERLFKIWDKEYKNICKEECNDDTREAARFILKRNIVCGNALTMRYCGDKGNKPNSPIAFSEWTFPFNDDRMQRKDYSFENLLAIKPQKEETDNTQLAPKAVSLFEAGLETPEKANEGGTFLREYITHYRCIQEDDNR